MGTMVGANPNAMFNTTIIMDDIMPPPPKVIARYSQYSNGRASFKIRDMYHEYKKPFFVPLKYVDAVMILNAACEDGSARIDGLGALIVTPDYLMGINAKSTDMETVEARHYTFYF